jgi:glycosyltransferase involved in cell wall biosynthesis
MSVQPIEKQGTGNRSAVRIALVQHGDFNEAYKVYLADADEPYAGLKASVKATDALVAGFEHVIINLNAPRGRSVEGQRTIVGLGRPKLPSRVPGRVVMWWWAREVMREIKRFSPTHVVMRTCGELAVPVLEYCAARKLPTLCIFANMFRCDDSRLGRVDRRVAQLVNDPCVSFAGNHRAPATNSMIHAGVDAGKAVVYDVEGTRHPSHYPVKRLDATKPVRIFFAGNMIESKGVGDLIRAVGLLRKRGLDVRLTAAGTGDDRPALHKLAMEIEPGHIEMPGSLGNKDVFERMLGATFVSVPTRHEFPEAMPLTMTEALASRTPVIASDHPVFVAAFKDGEGMRMVAQRNPEAIAAAIERSLEPAEYERLSRTTIDAFTRVECPVVMRHLMERWRAEVLEPAAGLAVTSARAAASAGRRSG